MKFDGSKLGGEQLAALDHEAAKDPGNPLATMLNQSRGSIGERIEQIQDALTAYRAATKEPANV